MMRPSFTTLALALSLLSAIQLAGASPTGPNLRSWVSSAGYDTYMGSRTSPCRTFASALDKTMAGGEIDIVDSENYGLANITKSITIDGQGALAAIQTTGNGIVVNAGTTDVVTIRNVSLNGFGTAWNGVRFLTGGTLILENVTISNFTGFGVEASRSSDSRLIMKNVSISNCDTGIFACTTGGNAYVDLESVKVFACGTGFMGTNGARVTMKGCNLSMNTDGLVISSALGISSRALLDNCIISNTTHGITVGPGTSLCRMSDCTISNNLVGITSNSGATLSSAGNNRITGNGTDGPIPPVFALR